MKNKIFIVLVAALAMVLLCVSLSVASSPADQWGEETDCPSNIDDLIFEKKAHESDTSARFCCNSGRWYSKCKKHYSYGKWDGIYYVSYYCEQCYGKTEQHVPVTRCENCYSQHCSYDNCHSTASWTPIPNVPYAQISEYKYCVRCAECLTGDKCITETNIVGCKVGYYGKPTRVNDGKCSPCPTGGTTADHGAREITECYLPAGTFSDSTGSGTYDDKCYYQN